MTVTTQNGEIIDIHEVSLQGNEISCKDPADRRRKKVLGVYADRRRATEIYAEIDIPESSPEELDAGWEDLCRRIREKYGEDAI